MPRASAGGEYAHPDLFAMAAAYAFHIAQNQPFVDGNKRRVRSDGCLGSGLGATPTLLAPAECPDGLLRPPRSPGALPERLQNVSKTSADPRRPAFTCVDGAEDLDPLFVKGIPSKGVSHRALVISLTISFYSRLLHHFIS